MSWLWKWADNDARLPHLNETDNAVDWTRVWPFFGIHVACFAVIWVGWSPVAVSVAIAAYLVRMFAITGFFHRYFSHKAFRTSRIVQFIFALIGTSATQRGPLWWAAHHRHHHRHSDTQEDPHSPRHGFWQSHCGWFLGSRFFRTPGHLIKDFEKFPELVWLDRYDTFIPFVFGFGLWCLGELLAFTNPALGTNGWQMLVWGYFISTVVLIHATLSINSFAHRFGKRRYQTEDDSRNNWLLALVTLGEGWHNNHHHYSGSARQGFFWWEVDITFYLLKGMEKLGLVWDLRGIPEKKKWAHSNATALKTVACGDRVEQKIAFGSEEAKSADKSVDSLPHKTQQGEFKP